MKKHKNKGKLFIENLEKRISTSPLLVHIKTAGGMGIIEKLKKSMGPAPTDFKENLSGDKFLDRIQEKQKQLKSMAIGKEELTGMHKHKAVKPSGDKFIDRITKKQKELKSMAMGKEELTGMHKHKAVKPSGDKFLERITKKQKELKSMAIGKEELAGMHKHKAVKPSGDKFLERITKKQEQLKGMAISKEELAREMISPKKLHQKHEGLLERLKKLLKEHSSTHNPHIHGA